MKTIFSLFALILFFINCNLSAQNVGISDVLFTPQSPLHIHRTSNGNMFQLTNPTTTNAAGRGLLINGTGLDFSFTNFENGYLRFMTNNLEHLRITNTGLVGIGTTAPSHKLTIQGPIETLRLIGPGGWGSTARLNFGDGNYVYIQEDMDDYLTIYGSNRTAIMGGNVGIGTLTPGQRLTVSGSLGIIEGGAAPAFHTILRGGDQTADITYTLPAAQGTTGSYLRNDGTGNLSWVNAGGGTKILDIVLTNATTYTLSGLDGDSDIGYRIILMGNHPNTNSTSKFCWISINGDNTATNYSYALDAWWNYSGYAWNYEAYSVGGILLYVTYASDNPTYICVDAVLSAFSGTRRHAIVQYSLGRGNTRNITDNLLAGVWTNTASNINSLVFNWTGNSGFSGRLIVYKFQS